MVDLPILELVQVTRRFGTVTAVDSAGFSLQEGSVTVLLGPSGCGKSTLLRMIAGLEPLDQGRILIAGTEVSSPVGMVVPERRGVGLVFQDNALFPHLDVAGNVAFGLRHVAPGERTSSVTELLERLQVAHLTKAWPHQLSGGEQQRVAIARALAREPALLLLDEPFSGLDSALRETVRETLMADLRAIGATVLVVTHDREEAMTIADQLVLMQQGRILQHGTPGECYREPASVAAARLLGNVVVEAAEIRDGTARSAIGTVPAEGWPDGPAVVVARTEDLELVADGNGAVVGEARFLGLCHRVEVAIGDQRVSLRITGEPPQAGADVGLRVSPSQAMIFTPGG